MTPGRVVRALACIGVSLFLSAYLLSSQPHHSPFAFALFHAGVMSDLPDAPISIPENSTGTVFRFRELPQNCVVFLYSSRTAAHAEFLHDVRVANYWHQVDVFKLDCDAKPTSCRYFAHEHVDRIQPPLLFFHDGYWSEALHDNHPLPRNRKYRVDLIHEWIDTAAVRASEKIKEDHASSTSARIGEQMGKQLFEEFQRNMESDTYRNAFAKHQREQSKQPREEL